MVDEPGIFQTIHTLRSVRSFKTDEVEREKLDQILEAATKAPSGGNFQPWHFIVVRDPKVKARIKEPILEAWRRVMKSPYWQRIPPASRPVYDEATSLVENTEKVPVLLFACIDLTKVSTTDESKYASIYPAAQNLMLAAHALGLGTCLTTHGSAPTRGEKEVKQILGVPESVKVACMIYLGYPSKKLGPPSRLPAKERAHYDRW